MKASAVHVFVRAIQAVRPAIADELGEYAGTVVTEKAPGGTFLCFTIPYRVGGGENKKSLEVCNWKSVIAN